MPCVRPIKYTFWPLLWSSDINVAHGAMPSRKWAIQPVKTNIVENSIPYLDRTKNRTHFPCGLHKFLSVILFSHSLCLLVEHEIFVCVCVRFCTGASNHSVQCFYWLHFTLPPVHYGFCCGDEVKEKKSCCTYYSGYHHHINRAYLAWSNRGMQHKTAKRFHKWFIIIMHHNNREQIELDWTQIGAPIFLPRSTKLEQFTTVRRAGISKWGLCYGWAPSKPIKLKWRQCVAPKAVSKIGTSWFFNSMNELPSLAILIEIEWNDLFRMLTLRSDQSNYLRIVLLLLLRSLVLSYFHSWNQPLFYDNLWIHIDVIAFEMSCSHFLFSFRLSILLRFYALHSTLLSINKKKDYLAWIRN